MQGTISYIAKHTSSNNSTINLHINSNIITSISPFVVLSFLNIVAFVEGSFCDKFLLGIQFFASKSFSTTIFASILDNSASDPNFAIPDTKIEYIFSVAIADYIQGEYYSFLFNRVFLLSLLCIPFLDGA